MLIFSFQGALPLNNDLLGEQASKCRAYAKALHYKEEEFHRGPTTETLEALIRYMSSTGGNVNVQLYGLLHTV